MDADDGGDVNVGKAGNVKTHNDCNVDLDAAGTSRRQCQRRGGLE